MTYANLFVVGLLLVSTQASAKDMDDILLEDLNSVSQLQVSMKAADQESEQAGQALLDKKYRIGGVKEKNDGMIVAFRPVRR